MTRQDAIDLVIMLESAYPRQILEEKSIETYVGFIQDLDHEVVKRVIANHIRSSKWFPTIAEIRELAAEMAHNLPSSEMAMETVRNAVRGNDYQAILRDDLLRQAVATVGWDKLMYSEYSQPLYKQIGDAYDNLRKRQIRRFVNTPAIGMTKQNALEG